MHVVLFYQALEVSAHIHSQYRWHVYAKYPASSDTMEPVMVEVMLRIALTWISK